MLAGAIGVLSLHINQKTEKAKAGVGPECLTGHHRGTTSQTKTSQQADCVGLWELPRMNFWCCESSDSLSYDASPHYDETNPICV